VGSPRGTFSALTRALGCGRSHHEAILTAASVILLPLTLIASIYGMNLPVPGEDEPFSFWVVVGLMGLMLVFLTILFRKRGWL